MNLYVGRGLRAVVDLGAARVQRPGGRRRYRPGDRRGLPPRRRGPTRRRAPARGQHHRGRQRRPAGHAHRRGDRLARGPDVGPPRARPRSRHPRRARGRRSPSGLAGAIWPRSTVGPGTSCVGAGGGAVASLLVLQSNSWSRLEPSAHPIELTCRHGRRQGLHGRGDLPQADVPRRRPRTTRWPILEDASADRTAGFRQVVPGQAGHCRPGMAPLFIESERLNATTTSAEEAAGYLTKPAMCPQLTADKPPPPDDTSPLARSSTTGCSSPRAS